MADKKDKPKTVDDIVAEFREYHHSSGKKFKDRMKKWEEFNDPENIIAQQFQAHAHYAVFGKPTDSKGFPGAYNEAYKVLDKHAKNDGDKLEDEDKLADILEKYADTFLQKAMGKSFDRTVKHAQERGLSKKDLRELKGQLLSQYYTEDGQHPTNVLSESYIKSLKGKKKIELINKLQNIGERTKDVYAQHLVDKSIGELFNEDDRTDVAEYITPIFKERGWKHKKEHIMRTVNEQVQHYSMLLHGMGKELQEKGYKTVKYEKKDDKKK